DIIFSLNDEEGNAQDHEFIPILSAEEEDQMDKTHTPEVLAILPLKNTVLFPGVVIPITVGRDKSIRLVNEANKGKKTIGVVTQINGDIEEPAFGDLFTIGTQASIMRM